MRIQRRSNPGYPSSVVRKGQEPALPHRISRFQFSESGIRRRILEIPSILRAKNEPLHVQASEALLVRQKFMLLASRLEKRLSECLSGFLTNLDRASHIGLGDGLEGLLSRLLEDESIDDTAIEEDLAMDASATTQRKDDAEYLTRLTRSTSKQVLFLQDKIDRIKEKRRKMETMINIFVASYLGSQTDSQAITGHMTTAVSEARKVIADFESQLATMVDMSRLLEIGFHWVQCSALERELYGQRVSFAPWLAPGTGNDYDPFLSYVNTDFPPRFILWLALLKENRSQMAELDQMVLKHAIHPKTETPSPKIILPFSSLLKLHAVRIKVILDNYSRFERMK